MKVTKITLKKIEASDGMVLTNGEAYGKKIYLGSTDKPENWQEITDAEYEEIKKEKEKELEESEGILNG